MPLPVVGAVLAGIRTLFARAAASSIARSAAGAATRVVGKKAFETFVNSRVAKGVTRVWRGIPEGEVAKDFTANASGEPGFKFYESSRSAAQKAAGEKGSVWHVDLPTPKLKDYSPQSTDRGTTQYSVPFAQHAAARQYTPGPFSRMANGLYDWFSDRVGSRFAASGRGQSSAQGNRQSSAFQSFQPKDSLSPRTTSWTSYFVRSWMSSGGSAQPNYPPGRPWSSTVRNFFSNVAGGNNWRSSGGGPGGTGGSGGSGGGSGSPPSSGGGTSSYPNITPANLVAMMGRTQPQIAAANAAAGAQGQAAQQQQLTNTTMNLGKAFQGLLAITNKTRWGLAIWWGSGIAPYQFGKAVTESNRSQVESATERLSRYDSAFASMKIQRRIQDINLSRREAVETRSSTQFLNSATLQGEKQLAELQNRITNITNYARGLLQHGANFAMTFAEWTPLFRKLSLISDIAEWFLGEKKKDDNAKKDDEIFNIPHKLIQEAIIQQKQNRQMKQKKPLEGIR